MRWAYIERLDLYETRFTDLQLKLAVGSGG